MVEEREFATLYDAGSYWVIEDKIFRRFPFKRQASTKTAIEMVFEFVELPDGGEAISRVYIPKDSGPKELIYQDLERWNKWWLKRKKELEVLEAFLDEIRGEKAEKAEKGGKEREEGRERKSVDWLGFLKR